MAEQIIVPVDLETKDAFKKFEADATKSGEAASKNIQNSFDKNLNSKISAIASSLTTKLLAVGAAVGGALISKKSIDLANIQEEAVNRINSALALTGKFSDAASRDLQNFASELQKVSTFGDEAILGAAASIQLLGNLPVDKLKQATTAAADLSSALRVDLSTAALLVAKASNGFLQPLSKYGVKIDESVPKSERFAAVLDLINKKFGGLSSKELNTFSGQIKSLENAFGDLLEQFGLVVTESPQIIFVINEIKKAIISLTDFMQKNRNIFDFGNAFTALAAFGSAFVTVFVQPIEAGISFISGLFSSNVKKIQSASLSLLEVFVSLASALQKVGLAPEVPASVQAIVDTFKSNIDQVQSKITETDQGLNATPFADGLKAKIDSVGESFLTMGEKAKIGFSNTSQAAARAAAATIDFRNVAISNISGGTQGFIKALQSGQNAFDAFGNMILDVLGNVAIFIGETLIAAGIGIDALKVSLGAFGGGAAIAAGIALIALGTILKGLSGGKATAGAGAGGASSPATAPTTQDITPEIEERKPETVVNLNVQGSIFDSRDTARRLADLLNAGFDQEGLRVRT